MSNPKNELTKKRRRSQNDEPSKKQAKSDSIEPTNMMDLNDDCLDHILKKLNHADLLNVADTSKRLMKAAQLAFKSKYRRHWVVLSKDKNDFEVESMLHIGFVNSLKVIRCFGQSISKLELNFLRVSERQFVELDRYINKYLVSFVTKLTIRGLLIVEPISKIETFTFLVDINKSMPYLRALSLLYCGIIQCITLPFAQLEHLKVFIEDDDLESLKSLRTGLRLNPQLKSLEIRGFDIDLQLLGIVSECAQLNSLAMFGSEYEFSTITKANPIQFKSVTELKTNGRIFNALVSSKASISFDHLEELEIDYVTKEKDLLDFFSKHPSISKLKFDFNYGVEISSGMAKVLPSVTEVNMWWNQISVHVAIDFVNDCELLKKFVYRLANRDDYEILQKRLGKEWQISIGKNSACVTLER